MVSSGIGREGVRAGTRNCGLSDSKTAAPVSREEVETCQPCLFTSIQQLIAIDREPPNRAEASSGLRSDIISVCSCRESKIASSEKMRIGGAAEMAWMQICDPSDKEKGHYSIEVSDGVRTHTRTFDLSGQGDLHSNRCLVDE